MRPLKADCERSQHGSIRTLNERRPSTRPLDNVPGCAAMDRRVQQIRRTLQQENASRLKVRDLAASVNLSVSRIQHLFKEQNDMTLGQYIKALRLRRAKQLLETSYLSVKQIVAELGRNDQSHFCRDFKKIYGISPAKYRTQFPMAPV